MKRWTSMSQDYPACEGPGDHYSEVVPGERVIRSGNREHLAIIGDHVNGGMYIRKAQATARWLNGEKL